MLVDETVFEYDLSYIYRLSQMPFQSINTGTIWDEWLVEKTKILKTYYLKGSSCEDFSGGCKVTRISLSLRRLHSVRTLCL